MNPVTKHRKIINIRNNKCSNKMICNGMKRRGFTIIELIIVVTIMGILLTIGVVNLRGSQANGRDAERKVDVDTIALHLETYYTSGIDATGTSSSDCTGGTITHNGGYTIHTFTVGDTLTCSSSFTADVLVVAGGGGGGVAQGGGGGAGGFKTGSLSLSNTLYTVSVGAGGSTGVNGSNSIFSSLTSTGGGRGGNFNAYNNVDAGQPGGSGGGGSSCYPSCASSGGVGSSGEGYNGGAGMNWTTGAYSSGGGGGAGTSGGAGTRGAAGSGGAGKSSSISGNLTYYSGGGAGYQIYESGAAIAAGVGGIGGGGAAGVNGINNSGGGGGASATGGSGIVIIRYLTPVPASHTVTYPSTALTATTASMIQYLRDIDTKSITAPGITDPTLTFISATCAGVCVQTTAGVTPQPTKDQYIYQPIQSDGTLCTTALQECRKFNLYYKLENATTDCPAPNNICMITSRNQ